MKVAAFFHFKLPIHLALLYCPKMCPKVLSLFYSVIVCFVIKDSGMETLQIFDPETPLHFFHICTPTQNQPTQKVAYTCQTGNC